MPKSFVDYRAIYAILILSVYRSILKKKVYNALLLYLYAPLVKIR